VIVTPEVGAAEIVLAAHAGLVVEGDALSLSRAIIDLTADVAAGREAGQRGVRFVSKHYRWSVIAEQMEKIYESVSKSPIVTTDRLAHLPG
jgi:glycosyltransferase involved in cell wall biosynthesis